MISIKESSYLPEYEANLILEKKQRMILYFKTPEYLLFTKIIVVLVCHTNYECLNHLLNTQYY